MEYIGPALELFDKLNTFASFFLFLIVIMAIVALTFFYKHFTTKEKYLTGGVITLFLLAFGAPLYFYETKGFRYSSSKDISKMTDDLKCYYGDSECEFDTEEQKIMCSYWKGEEEDALDFKYKKLHTRIEIPKDKSPINIDGLFIVISDVKFSTKGDNFYANFGLRSSITEHMLSLKEHRELNVTVCEKPCTAKQNTNYTYTIKEKSAEIETVFDENCKEKIFMKQSINGCDSHSEFDISIPLNNKNVYMKDNRYVFIGTTTQSSLPLYSEKTRFDVDMEINFIDPEVCFILAMGKNELKIEDGKVRLNGKNLAIPNLNKEEPAFLRVQRNVDSISIRITQEDIVGDEIRVGYPPNPENKITIGHILNSKQTKKKDILSVYIKERYQKKKTA